MRAGQSRSHNYAIDVLRIIAMLMIIAHHFVIHGNPEVENDWTSVLVLGGKTGVNIFVLITGYYASRKINKSRLLGLVTKTTVYSIVLTVSAMMCVGGGISKKNLLKAVFPIVFGGNYWFITTYLELALMIPFLLIIIDNISKEQYKRILCFSLIAFCIIPTVLNQFIQTNDFGYSTVVWFVFIFFIGQYIRLYGFPFMEKRPILALLSCIMCLIFHGASAVLQRHGLGKEFKWIAEYQLNALLPLLIAVLVFLLIKRVSIHNRFGECIKLIGSSMIGVYLFHDNASFKPILWKCMNNLFGSLEDAAFPVYALLCIGTVFLLGIIVELIYLKVSEIAIDGYKGISKIIRRE